MTWAILYVNDTLNWRIDYEHAKYKDLINNTWDEDRVICESDRHHKLSFHFLFHYPTSLNSLSKKWIGVTKKEMHSPNIQWPDGQPSAEQPVIKSPTTRGVPVTRGHPANYFIPAVTLQLCCPNTVFLQPLDSCTFLFYSFFSCPPQRLNRNFSCIRASSG